MNFDTNVPDVPPPAELPVIDFSTVQSAAHNLLLAIDGVEVHSSRTAYLTAARAQVLSAQSHIEAHFLALGSHPSQSGV